MKLFDNIKALFANKPLVVVANKTDIKKIDELPQEKKVFFVKFYLKSYLIKLFLLEILW